MNRLDAAVIANLVLIITHQIDAAYWHEWEMFAMPGGIQFFNMLNILIFFALLACLPAIFSRRATGYRNALILAACGSVILPVHTGFAVAGFEQFNLPLSQAVIVGSFVTAAVQFVLTRRARAEFG